MKACKRGPSGADAPRADWTELTDQLPEPADEKEREDVIWKAFKAQFGWYHNNATTARYWYVGLRLAAMTAAAAVTVLAASKAPPALTASLAAVIVVAEGAQQLFQFHANWINYRRSAEEMRQHAFLYVASAPPYDRSDRRDRFVKAMQDLIAAEGVNWSAAVRRAAGPPGADAPDSDP